MNDYMTPAVAPAKHHFTTTFWRSVLTETEVASPSPAFLDVGCGAGGMMRRIAQGFSEVGRAVDLYGFDVTGTESSHYIDFPIATVSMLEAECPGIGWAERVTAVASWRPVAVRDGYIDVVVSNQVLEHVADLDQYLTELARVLTPGGISVAAFSC